MIQVCDPPRQRQVRRLSAEEFFTLVRCGGAGFYRPCYRGATDADRRRSVGHSRGGAAGAAPHRRYRRRSSTAQLAGTQAAGRRLSAHSAGEYRRGTAHPAGGNCRRPGRPAAPQGHGMGGGGVHRNGGSAACRCISGRASGCGRCARWKALRPAFCCAPAACPSAPRRCGCRWRTGYSWRCCWQRAMLHWTAAPTAAVLHWRFIR